MCVVLLPSPGIFEASNFPALPGLFGSRWRARGKTMSSGQIPVRSPAPLPAHIGNWPVDSGPRGFLFHAVCEVVFTALDPSHVCQERCAAPGFRGKAGMVWLKQKTVIVWFLERLPGRSSVEI